MSAAIQDSATLTPKAVLITGAAKRVGAEIARTLHAVGCNVVIHCNRSTAEADALAASLNQKRVKSAAVVTGDLLADNALTGLIDQAHSCFGRLDGLVNNASSFYATPVGKIDLDDWLDIMGSNLKAPLFLSQAAAPYLRQTKGAIVNIIDIHTEHPLKDFVVYNAAKAGLAGLTRAFALELGPDVRVNGVSPGAIMWPDASPDYPPAERERIINQVPLKRVGSALDIAGAVKFLLLEAPYVTGQILAVDGGREICL
ncbi:MAG: pteridine reductase [Rhodocyclaceae bacterium]|nr:pteridine reductase [Rhodocyclaceae bacterium]